MIASPPAWLRASSQLVQLHTSHGTMGILFSRRVGSDPYYLSYEKSFEKITKREEAIKERGLKRRKWMQSVSSRSSFGSVVWSVAVAAGWGWVHRQHVMEPYTRTWWILMGVSVGIGVLLASLAVLLNKIQHAFEGRDSLYLKRLDTSRKKMLQELKDATHYEKTMALLKKYDPEARPPPPPPQGTPRLPGSTPLAVRRGPGAPPGSTAPTPGSQLLKTVGGAGKALFPVFDTLANSVIGDNPELVENLRRAEQELAALKQENEQLRRRVAELEGHADGGPELLALDGPPSPDIGPDNSSGAGEAGVQLVEAAGKLALSAGPAGRGGGVEQKA